MSRSRRFESPTPCALLPPGGKPRPVSATDNRSPLSCCATDTVIFPPSRTGSTPCLTAFSSKVISIIGGKGSFRKESGTAISKLRRLPMRICRMER